MLEPWRSRYLHALGVEVYLPRYPLPSAAPSIELEWDEAPVEPLDDPAIVFDDAAVIAPNAKEPVLKPDLPSFDAQPDHRKAHPRVEQQKVAASTTTAAVPRLRLSIVASEGGILVIDDAFPSSRGDAQRLIGSLLFALQQKNESTKVESFEWPLPNLRNSRIELSEQAARETLASFLQRKVAGNIHTILLLGNAAQQWVDTPLREALAASQPLRWGSSVSTLAVLGDAAFKRQWWQDLRTVISR